jgi:hypothetical protein
MLTTIALKRVALVVVLAGAVVGTAEAQTLPPDATRTCKVASGAFTMSADTASFHLTLDDLTSSPATFVVMKFINQSGAVVRSRTTSIDPGASATLEYSGTGLYRVQAEIFDLPGTSFGNGRTISGSIELRQTVVNGTDKFRFIPPGPWTCKKFLEELSQ